MPIKEMFLTADGDESRPTFRLGGPDLALIGMLTAPLVFLILFGWPSMVKLAGTAVAMVQ